MAFQNSMMLLIGLLLSLSCLSQAIKANQSQFFSLMRNSVSGSALSDWNVSAGGKPFCNFTGVTCDHQGYVVKLDVSGFSLNGKFPAEVCSYLPKLRVLGLSNNKFTGEFPGSIVNCTFLEELNTSRLYQTGKLPDFSPMKSLRILDLSYNLYDGDFPMSITNLTNLEVVNFNEVERFRLWQLPENISRLTKLKSMVFTTCMLHGRIPAAIGNMTSLVDLELSGNYLVGEIPAEMGLLTVSVYVGLSHIGKVGS